MLPQTLTTGSDVLPELIDHHADGSVSIYARASRIPSETNTARIALKNLTAAAENRLRESGLREPEVAAILSPARELQNDEEFWHGVNDSVALFAAPGEFRAYTFAGSLADDRVGVNERWDVGPLVRAITSVDRAWILSVSRGDVHLYTLIGDALSEVALDLPDDLHVYLVHAENYGDADRDRAEGRKGDRPEFQKYCTVVDAAVRAAIGESTRPVVLNASPELDTAYRQVTALGTLLEARMSENPGSLSPADLADHARAILDEHTRSKLSQWRETFGTRRANNLATSRLAEVALAATAGAVDELLFDPDTMISGRIDDQGALTKSDDGYDVVDAIVQRVIARGGTVRGVRNRDLVDGSPVAATLRFPISVPGTTDPLA